ncbi:MAG: hypothetical protein CSA35_06980 [Dethiosulfovibrio peptidovorans]|nr:MAG: hypothetical protein CSA35_06980 [Dethiosulfovibrio peptidovorans]
MFAKPRLSSAWISVVVFILCCGPAWAADGSLSLRAYLTKVLLGVVLLGCVGFLLVRWGPKRFRASGNGLEVLTSLSLGRGVLYVVRCGSEVILLGESRGGLIMLRRYPLSQWEQSHESTDSAL